MIERTHLVVGLFEGILILGLFCLFYVLLNQNLLERRVIRFLSWETIIFGILWLIILSDAFEQFQEIFHVHFIIDIFIKIGRLM